MAKPQRTAIDSNSQNNWDTTVNDNFAKLYDAPLPLHRFAGDETALELTFPAAAYEDSIVWCTHSVSGNSLMASDGTAWVVALSI